MKNRFLLITLCACFSLFSEVQALKDCFGLGIRKRNRVIHSPIKVKKEEHLLQKLQKETISPEKTNPLLYKVFQESKDEILKIIEILLQNNNWPGIRFLITHEDRTISTDCINQLISYMQACANNNPKKLTPLFAFLAKTAQEAKYSQETYLDILTNAFVKTAKNNKKIHGFFKKQTTTLDVLYNALHESIQDYAKTNPEFQEKMAYEFWRAVDTENLSNELLQLTKINQLFTHAALFMAKQARTTELQKLFNVILVSDVIRKNFYDILYNAIIKTTDNQKALDTICETLNTVMKNAKINRDKAFIIILKSLDQKKQTQSLNMIIKSIITNQIDDSILELLHKTPHNNKTIIDSLKKAQDEKTKIISLYY